MNDYLGIPELRGFRPVCTVDELAAAIARLPEDWRSATIRDKLLVLVNEPTDEVAILRPADDGSWHVEVFAFGSTEAIERRQRRRRRSRPRWRGSSR